MTRKNTYHSQDELNRMALKVASPEQRERLEAFFNAPAAEWKVQSIIESGALAAIFLENGGVFGLLAPSGKFSRPTAGQKSVKYNRVTLERSFA